MPGLDIDQLQRQALARLRQSAGGRRDALALRQSAVESGQPVASQAGPLAELVSRAHGRPGRRGRLVRCPPQVVRSETLRRFGLCQLAAQSREQRRGRFTPELDPLAGGAHRVVPLAGLRGRRELVLRESAFRRRRDHPRLGADGERALGPRQPLVQLPCAPGELDPFQRRRPGSLLRFPGCRVERLFSRSGRGLLDVAAQAGLESLGRLATQLQPLDRAPHPVERRRCALAAARRVRQLLLRRVALGQRGLERPVDAAPRERRGQARILGLRELSLQRLDVELRDPSVQRCDLSTEPLGTLRRRRLERERPKPRPNLLLDVARPLDLSLDARELQLGAVAPQLETPEPCRLLHERPPLLGAAGEDLLDAALRDDGPEAAAEPCVREQLHQIEPAHRSTVDEVLTLPAAVQPARNRHLREVELRQRAVLVVEHQLDLAGAGRGPALRAREQDVVRTLGPQLARALTPRGPEQRVGDIRLPGAVRPDHDRDTRLQPDLDRVRERFEPADLDRLQVHRRQV